MPGTPPPRPHPQGRRRLSARRCLHYNCLTVCDASNLYPIYGNLARAKGNHLNKDRLGSGCVQENVLLCSFNMYQKSLARKDYIKGLLLILGARRRRSHNAFIRGASRRSLSYPICAAPRRSRISRRSAPYPLA
jgi:hypothetical protein